MLGIELYEKTVKLTYNSLEELANEIKNIMKPTIQVARVSVQRAVELLGLSPLSVQGALINKALTIEGAWENEGSSCYT